MTAAGAVLVKADDRADLSSNIKLVTSSITTNDGGAAVLGETINDFIPADFSTDEARDEFGVLVLITPYEVPEGFVEAPIEADFEVETTITE